MEYVGCWRVVQDQGFVEVSAQAAQVFHIAALVKHTRLPEQPGPEHIALIQQVRHWVRILRRSGDEPEREKQGLVNGSD